MRCHCLRGNHCSPSVRCTLRIRWRHMLVGLHRPYRESCRLLAVEAIWSLGGPGRGGVVAVFEVRTGLVYRWKAGAERCGGLWGLSCGFLLCGAFEELLKTEVVFSRLGQQRGRVLVGKQARLGNGSVSNGHERFCTLWDKYKKDLLIKLFHQWHSSLYTVYSYKSYNKRPCVFSSTFWCLFSNKTLIFKLWFSEHFCNCARVSHLSYLVLVRTNVTDNHPNHQEPHLTLYLKWSL